MGRFGIIAPNMPLFNRPLNVWCVGRNYADHAKELGNSVPAEPLIFLKSGSSVLFPTSRVELPWELGAIHHEVELAVRWSRPGHLSDYGVALDLTARDQQSKLKAQGHPWTLAKSFRNSTWLGNFHPLQDLEALQRDGTLELMINGETRQRGRFADMVHGVRELAAYIERYFPVEPGDVLLTGTPAGVGPLQPGDHVQARVNNFEWDLWKLA